MLCDYASLLESSPFSATTNAYIITSQKLDFEVRPRPNIICPSMPIIQVHKSKTASWGYAMVYHLYLQALHKWVRT